MEEDQHISRRAPVLGLGCCCNMFKKNTVPHPDSTLLHSGYKPINHTMLRFSRPWPRRSSRSEALMPAFFLAENNACNQSGLHACQLECLPANSPTMGTKSPWNARHHGAARVYEWRGREGWNSGASRPMLDFGGAGGAISPPLLESCRPH